MSTVQPELRICKNGHEKQLVGKPCRPCRVIWSVAYAKKESPEIKGWKSLKENAHRKGLLLDLSFEEYKVLRHKPCYYCGVNFTRGNASYALDRVDNTLGYLKSNIVVCCYACNHAKAGMTLSQFVRMCHCIANKHLEII